jgi:hypothetical protein
MSGRCMKPKWAVTRQKPSPSCATDINSGHCTRGRDPVSTPLKVRVRNTAVPGTRGTPRALRSARKSDTEIGISASRSATATVPRCQISMMP